MVIKNNLIVILGPTASGKTSLAVKLAVKLRGEIISADSRQVYRGMDIGTGKDLSEFQVADRIIPYHLMDILEPQQEFSVFEFQKKFYDIFNAITGRKVLPILVGGTGLYLESVLIGYTLPQAIRDEELRKELEKKSLDELRDTLLSMTPHLHNKTDLKERERIIRKIEIEKAREISMRDQQSKPRIQALVFGIHWERDILRQRIADRLKHRLNNGLIEEVSRLHAQGLSWERLDSFGLEYRYIARYLQNELSKDKMISGLQIAIGQFAKRQTTWFRRMEKKGVKIEWLRGDDFDGLCFRVLDKLK